MPPIRHSLIRNAIAPVALLALLAGCAPTFEARVARFSVMPPPASQSFVIEPHDPANTGSLEFATYANLVRQRLAANGYVEAASPAQASLVVQLDYNVGPPREKVQTRPGFGGFGGGVWGPGFGPGYGWSPYWGGWNGGFGGWGGMGGWGGGMGGWGGNEVYSVTQYSSQLAMKIVRSADKASVFEGRAETISTTNNLTRLVPNLVTAIFTNFPGSSGETVRVRFDPEKPTKPANVTPVR